jgi:hypothetical protein
MSVANEENAVKMSDYDEGFRAGMQIVLDLAHIRIEDLEAKLAKAMQALELALDFADNDLVDFDKYGLSCDADINERYRTTIAELSSVSCANLKG